ncbi:MAG TPA: ATP-binding cassette domain-containing protein [Actinoplanes sp.]|nr:ATP-binding cassette domain-containing protein [Actinoplanes sp.]
MLNFEDVSKSFGSTRALEQVTLRLEPGTVVGLVGHNGAGKSTLMRMAVGLTRPDRGRVTVGGVAVGQFGNLAGLVGASFDASTLPGGWSALTALQATAALSGIPAERVREVLAMVGMTGAAKRRTKTYSMGMRQRLAIALALLALPRVLILDEPTNALDPTACHDLRTWIRKHAEAGNTVLVSSHNLPELEQVADRVVVMQRGRIVRDATTSDLLTGGASLVRAERPDLLRDQLLRAGHHTELLDDGVLRVTGTTSTEIGRVAASHRLVLSELSIERRQLSEIYQLAIMEGTRV